MVGKRLNEQVSTLTVKLESTEQRAARGLNETGTFTEGIRNRGDGLS